MKLYDGHGDTGSSVTNATFSDAATDPAPYNGSATDFLLPVGALSAFNGLDLFGTWSILTQDFIVPGDGTSLAASSITVDAVPEPAMLGLFGLSAAGLVTSRRRKAA